MIAAFFIFKTMANKNNSTQTKYINTNVNDYARPVSKKGSCKNIYPFNEVRLKPIKVKQSSS